jgi:hypothetical protein
LQKQLSTSTNQTYVSLLAAYSFFVPTQKLWAVNFIATINFCPGFSLQSFCPIGTKSISAAIPQPVST